MTSSNTIPKQLLGKGFKKGDPRINRQGRPKTFDALRALGLRIADESVATAAKKLGSESVKPEIAKLTVAEMILRKWAFSPDHQLQKAYIEITFGKVPDEVKLGGEPIRLCVEYINKTNGNGEH